MRSATTVTPPCRRFASPPQYQVADSVASAQFSQGTTGAAAPHSPARKGRHLTWPRATAARERLPLRVPLQLGAERVRLSLSPLPLPAGNVGAPRLPYFLHIRRSFFKCQSKKIRGGGRSQGGGSGRRLLSENVAQPLSNVTTKSVPLTWLEPL